MDSFLRRVIEQRNAEQMEAERIKTPKILHACEDCGKNYMPRERSLAGRCSHCSDILRHHRAHPEARYRGPRSPRTPTHETAA